MLNLFYKLREEKSLIPLFLVAFVTALIDFSVFVFDVVELILIKKNSASISSLFVKFNLIAIIASFVLGLAILIYLIWRKKEIKSK